MPWQRWIAASSPAIAGGIACSAPSEELAGRLQAAGACVRLHEIPCRRHVHLPIAGARESRVHVLELLDRLRRSSERELEASECALRSLAVEPKASLDRDLDRRCRIRVTGVRVAGRRVDVGEQAEARADGRMLLELAAQLDGFARCGIRGPPAAAIKVRGGKQPQRLRQERERGSLPRPVERAACQAGRFVVVPQHEPPPTRPHQVQRRLVEHTRSLSGDERALEPTPSPRLSGHGGRREQRLRDEELADWVAVRAPARRDGLAASAAEAPPTWSPAPIASASSSAARDGSSSSKSRAASSSVSYAASWSSPYSPIRPRQREQLGARRARRVRRQPFGHERSRIGRPAGQPRRVGGVGKEHWPLLPVRRQSRGTFKRRCCCRIRAADTALGGNRRERARRFRVGPCRRRGRMPRVSKLVAPFEHVGERAMGIAPLRRRRALVHRSSNERVAELDLRPVDAEQIGVLCTKEVAGTGPKHAAGGFNDRDAARVICGRDEERSARPLAEHERTTGERSLDSRAHA